MSETFRHSITLAFLCLLKAWIRKDVEPLWFREYFGFCWTLFTGLLQFCVKVTDCMLVSLQHLQGWTLLLSWIPVLVVECCVMQLLYILPVSVGLLVPAPDSWLDATEAHLYVQSSFPQANYGVKCFQQTLDSSSAPVMSENWCNTVQLLLDSSSPF